MENDFNSSDIAESDHEDATSRVGSRAIASIIAASVTDRIESKRTVKTLKDTANAPGTTAQRKYYWKLFSQFAQRHCGSTRVTRR